MMSADLRVVPRAIVRFANRPVLRLPPLCVPVFCALGLSALIAGCDQSAFTSTPSSACAELGAQCQLSGGPLGVCEGSECEPGVKPPCFKCVSQH